MEIKGRITHVLESQTGEGKKGTWTKQGFVLVEIEGDYPKSIAFDAFNKDFTIKEGDIVTVSINIESREYQGKWYTNINAWKVDTLVPANDTPQQESNTPEPDNLPF